MSKAYEEDLKEQRETWKQLAFGLERALDRAMTSIGQIHDALNDPLCFDREPYLFRIIHGVKKDVANILSAYKITTGNEPVEKDK